MRQIARLHIIQLIYFNFCLPFLRWLPFPSTFFGPVKGQHPSFEKWLEDRDDSHFRQEACRGHRIVEVKPSRPVETKSPGLAIPGVPENFVNQAIYTRPKTYIAHLSSGRIATRQFEVIAPDDRVFNDFFFSSADDDYPAQSLLLPMLPKLKKKSGVYITIGTGRAGNYYHWLNDCLTRLWLVELQGLSNYKLIVPEKLTPFQEQSLNLLGFSTDRLAPFGQDHWQVEYLIIPSLVNPANLSSPEACSWLRERFLSAVKPVTTSLPQKIYISRAQASKRRLINEPEVVSLLEQHGFVPISTETMTFDEQINLFRQAEVVVAPHGAGLSNIIFMRPNALVVELLSARRARPCYVSLASAVDVNYACVTDASEQYVNMATGRQPDTDFSIPIERLALALHKLGL